jgi:hypothetical protein
MTENTETTLLGVLVITLLVLTYWGVGVENKRNYNIAQKFILMQSCKNPHYKGNKVKYIKQFYQNRTMELALENGQRLTLPYDQVMNILCE